MSENYHLPTPTVDEHFFLKAIVIELQGIRHALEALTDYQAIQLAAASAPPPPPKPKPVRGQEEPLSMVEPEPQDEPISLVEVEPPAPVTPKPKIPKRG